MRRDEFVTGAELRPDGSGARPEGYWEDVSNRAPEGDACRICGADGDDVHDVRRVHLPNHDLERVALCASCRSMWEGDS